MPSECRYAWADQQPGPQLRLGRHRHEPLDQVHRALVQRAAGGAVGQPLDAAVGRVRRVSRDAGQLRALRVLTQAL